VLKTSTSKLIANDALDLSVFITDNTGLDTSDVALSKFAESDLLIFQNKFEEAFEKLDTLISDFPEHSLQDDVFYVKGQVFEKKREYLKAEEMYKMILEDFPSDIRADNALYNLARLYDNQLNNPEKAKEHYEKLFIDYSNSTFAVEARKRFRELRGDSI
jgi:TolA-binding protein